MVSSLLLEPPILAKHFAGIPCCVAAVLDPLSSQVRR